MFVNESTTRRDVEAATFGHALSVLGGTRRSSLSLVSIQAWLHVPIRLDQIIILFGADKVPEAYITWAYVTPETAARLACGKGRPPFPEEWNDGSLLWIVDVVAPFGGLSALVRAARAQLGQHASLGYSDRRKLGVQLKRRLRGKRRNE